MRLWPFASKAQPTEPRSVGPNVYEGWVGNWPVEDWHALVEKKGVEVYAEMYERDDMVRSSILTLQLAALHKGYRCDPAPFEKAEEESREEEAARFAADAWTAMAGSPIENLRTLLSPLYMGFVCIEPIWTDVLTDGEWAGKRRYSRLKPLRHEYVKFHMDAHGDVTEIVQETQGYGAADQYIHFEPSELIYWAHDAGDGNPYGRSLLDPAFPAYFGKLEAEKAWVRYCERFGTPIPWGEYPADAGEDYKSTFLTVLKSIRTSATFAVPQGWKVNLWQAQHAEQVAFFTEFFAHADRRIARAIGIPSLVNENTETGAYSLGQAHLTTLGQRIAYYQQTIEDVIQEQWLEPLHRENYPPEVGCPSFKLQPFGEEDLKLLAEIGQMLSGMGLPIAQADLYEKFPFRRPEEDEETIKAPAPVIMAPQPVEEGPDEEEPEEAEEEETELPPEMVKNQFAKRELNELEQRIDFAGMDRDEALADDIAAENFAIIFESIAQQVTSGKANGARRRR